MPLSNYIYFIKNTLNLNSSIIPRIFYKNFCTRIKQLKYNFKNYKISDTLIKLAY